MSTLPLSRREFLLRSAALAAVASSAGCAKPKNSEPFRPDRVFLITIDTLRRDHLPWHGYPRNTMPFVNALTRNSVYFKEAICACSNTTPSHTSIFSGLHTAQHGMFHNSYEKLNPGLYLLSDYFSDAGFDTAGFASVIWMRQFNQGFKTFDTYSEKYIQEGSTTQHYRNAQGTFDEALKWLNTQTPTSKFFNFVHVYDPHILDAFPPDGILEKIETESEKHKQEIFQHWTQVQYKHVESWPYQGDKNLFTQANNVYDAQITFVDQEIKRYYGEAEKLGLLKNSLWIITSDHGEGLGSHMYKSHGKHIYQEQISCPLVFHTPGNEIPPQANQHRVHHLDIFPTLTEMMGHPLPESKFTRFGNSFWGEINGKPKTYQASSYFCQRRYKLDFGFSKDWDNDPVYTLIEGDYGYIVNSSGNDELYNLAQDPYQLQNLSSQNLAQGGALRDKARELYAKLDAEGGHAKAPATQEETATPFDEALGSMGYL